MRELLHKHFDKLLILCLFSIVLAAFIWDPNKEHGETYKPLLAGLAGGLLTMVVTKGAPSAPTTTTKTESPDTGAVTETRTEPA